MAENKKDIRFSPFREKMYEVIFEADTPAGKAFDVILLIAILISVIVVLLESIESVNAVYGKFFFYTEWILTFFFTIEYLLRLYCTHRPTKYATSFFGVIDLLAVIPTYLSLIVSGSQYLLVIRALRLMRVFRIFKLANFLKESQIIIASLRASRIKITVFLTFIMLAIVVIGSVMYLIEGGTNEGFSSIPKSIYWSIVTLTTVGYGDISPITNLGQFIAAIVMILGYAVIAVPTGIVSAEMVQRYSKIDKRTITTQVCSHCLKEGHASDADYCKYCGAELHPLRGKDK